LNHSQLQLSELLKEGVCVPKSDKRIEEKKTKTIELLKYANLVLAPLYLVDKQIGLVAALTFNAFFINYLHDLGKRRRSGANTLNKINTFFSSQGNENSLEVHNALRNIINGGAAIHDEISEMLQNAGVEKSRIPY